MKKFKDLKIGDIIYEFYPEEGTIYINHINKITSRTGHIHYRCIDNNDIITDFFISNLSDAIINDGDIIYSTNLKTLINEISKIIWRT